MEDNNKASELTYEDAINELREILKDLQGDLSHIDDLEKKMVRAGLLIKFCTEKIKNIEVRIDDIISEIDSDSESGD